MEELINLDNSTRIDQTNSDPVNSELDQSHLKHKICATGLRQPILFEPVINQIYLHSFINNDDDNVQITIKKVRINTNSNLKI